MNNMKNIMGKYMDRYTKIAKKLLNKSRKVVEAPDDGGGTIPSLEEIAYAIAERVYYNEDFDSAKECIEANGGVDAFMEYYLSSDTIELSNLDDEVVKELFRLRNERVEEVNTVAIVEPIDNLDLVVEEVLKLDKNITTFIYLYSRNEPVYPTLTLEQQQRLGEKFPNLVVPSV